ncbi:PIG-L family deacetylase (plasmid) [Streptomyces sp. NBC_01426]|uniref:PIG-L deacetylase family protein n=1 Tax=Streptomyces sp. NBC_01426 TaxID=2975866 RepID=UPI002E3154F8|nr:PIG-L deacetylase family protein [Streptomyces sp. NBC_01426]
MKPSSLPSLLAVFAHPDDEALVAGGVLAQHAAAGARTAVVTATWAPDTGRAAELTHALRVLGAGKPRMLGYADLRVPDSAPGRPRLCDVPREQVVERLVAHIRAVRPQVIVTHDAFGSGHPDHVRTHEVVLEAARTAGIAGLHSHADRPWQPSAVYGATHPCSESGALDGLLATVGKRLHTVQNDMAHAAVDIRPWLDRKIAAILDRKIAAIMAHSSETARERSLPGLLARLPGPERDAIVAMEFFTRLDAGYLPGPDRLEFLTV